MINQNNTVSNYLKEKLFNVSNLLKNSFLDFRNILTISAIDSVFSISSFVSAFAKIFVDSVYNKPIQAWNDNRLENFTKQSYSDRLSNLTNIAKDTAVNATKENINTIKAGFEEIRNYQSDAKANISELKEKRSVGAVKFAQDTYNSWKDKLEKKRNNKAQAQTIN